MEDYFLKITKYYTPSLPVQSSENFFGRRNERSQLYKSLITPGRQSLIYGERGVGKTSLINIVSEYFCSTNEYTFIRHTCGKHDNFEKIFSTLFVETGLDKVLIQKTEKNNFNSDGKIKTPLFEIGKGKIKEKGYSYQKFIETKITPQLISTTFRNKKIILNIDEFDRIQNTETIQLIAETVKSLSDSNCKLKLVISGVSKSSKELIGEHPSIKRNIYPISVKRMLDNELEKIIEFGAKNLNLEFSEIVKKIIIHLSSGLPYFTHYLAENLADNAFYNKRTDISLIDLTDNISIFIDNDLFEDSKEFLQIILSNNSFNLFSDGFGQEMKSFNNKKQKVDNYYLKLILFISPFLKRINEQELYEFIQIMDFNNLNYEIKNVDLTNITITLEELENLNAFTKINDDYLFQDAFFKTFIFLKAFEFFDDEKISNTIFLQTLKQSTLPNTV